MVAAVLKMFGHIMVYWVFVDASGVEEWLIGGVGGAKMTSGKVYSRTRRAVTFAPGLVKLGGSVYFGSGCVEIDCNQKI